MKILYAASFTKFNNDIEFTEAELVDQSELRLLLRLLKPKEEEKPRWHGWWCGPRPWRDTKEEAVDVLINWVDNFFSYTVPLLKERISNIKSALNDTEYVKGNTHLYQASHHGMEVSFRAVELLPNAVKFIQYFCDERYLPDDKVIQLTEGDKQIRGPKDGRGDVVLSEPAEWFLEEHGWYHSKREALVSLLQRESYDLYGENGLPQWQRMRNTLSKWIEEN